MIISRLPWSGEARRLIGPGAQIESSKADRAGGQIESPEAHDHEGSATHDIKQ